MGPMCDMCHHLIGRKSKFMDKVIKEIQESQWESDTWQDEDIKTIWWRKRLVGKRKKRREKEEREAPTSFYDLQTSVGWFSLG